MKELRIKDICTKDSSSLKQKELKESGKYPVYGASGIAGYLDHYEQKEPYISIVKDGSGIGRVSFQEAKSSLIGTMQYILPKEGYSIRYIGYCLQSLNLSKYKQGAAIPHIYFRDYGESLVKVTDDPLDQQRIVGILDAEFEKIDALKANAEKNFQNAKDLFQAALKMELEPKQGWETKKLGEFANMKAGDFIKASDIHDVYYEGSYPCYGGNGLRGYVDEPNRNGEFCLIGRQGALCGNIHIAKGIFRATEHAVVVTPYLSMPTKLVYYLLVSLNLNKYSTGAAQPGLSVANIAEKVLISIPPMESWNGIVNKLDALYQDTCSLQDNYTQTIALCDDLKQALLRKAFSGEL